MDKIVEYWPISILLVGVFVFTLFITMFKLDNYMKYHKLKYRYACAQALVFQHEVKINELKEQIHEGNIKYLEAKKEWLNQIYQIQLSNNNSVFQVKQDIDKIEKQIKNLKSK